MTSGLRRRSRCHSGGVTSSCRDHGEPDDCVSRCGTDADHAQKKSLIAAEQLRPDVVAERTAWDIKTHRVNSSRDVFLDEANAKTTMTRLSGRAPRGQRVVDHVPDGRWSSTTMLAGIHWNGAGPCLTYSAGTAVPTMQAFVEQLLAPVLSPDHIVVMDNLNSHKHPEVVAAIASWAICFRERFHTASEVFTSLRSRWLKSWLR